MPDIVAGSSSAPMFQSYNVVGSSVNAHDSGVKQAPPPPRKNPTWAGSAGRSKKLNGAPSAHMQSSEVSIAAHSDSAATDSAAVGSVVGGVLASAPPVATTVPPTSNAPATAIARTAFIDIPPSDRTSSDGSRG